MAIKATFLDGDIPVTLTETMSAETRWVIDQLRAIKAKRGSVGPGVLECREHDDDPDLADLRDESGRVRGASLYLSRRERAHGPGDYWVFCHHPSNVGRFKGGCSAPLMTDQHRWQQDYAMRSGQAAALEVDDEHWLDTKTRLDVALHDPVTGLRTGIEVQHSDISIVAARTRDDKALRAGYQLAWSADHANAAWARKFTVGHYAVNELPGRSTPLGTWRVASGVRTFELVRCDQRGFPHGCWLAHQTKARSKRHCGGWHPVWNREPYRGMVVDDVIEGMGYGELVRLDTQTTQNVVLIPKADAQLWRDEVAPLLPTRKARTGATDKACETDIRARVARPKITVWTTKCRHCGRLSGQNDGWCGTCRALQSGPHWADGLADGVYSLSGRVPRQRVPKSASSRASR